MSARRDRDGFAATRGTVAGYAMAALQTPAREGRYTDDRAGEHQQTGDDNDRKITRSR
jgi:hypothetical protein